jgi:hypothetical protein
MGHPAAIKGVTYVNVGSRMSAAQNIAADGRVLFRNLSDATTRIIFRSRNSRDVDCEADDREVTRSRKGQ